MGSWTAFVCGVFIGVFLGMFIIGTLVSPRIEELQDTVAGLREYIRFNEGED